MGDNHPCRQIDVIADQEHLTFPDDAVGLQRPPDGSTRPADWRHIARRSVLLFVAVRHAASLDARAASPGGLGRKILCEEAATRDTGGGRAPEGQPYVTGRPVRTVYHSGAKALLRVLRDDNRAIPSTHGEARRAASFSRDDPNSAVRDDG